MVVTKPTTSTPASATQAPASAKKSLGKDDFMKLLITQLTTQDPLKPMDSQDFGAQLAQFSSLEQMTNVNENLKQLQAMQASVSSSSTVNLIGKKVNAQGNTVQHTQGKTQNLGFSLTKDAQTVSIDIFDANGTNVRTINVGNQPAGSNSYQWDGKDAKGNELPTGAYTFNVTAADATGNVVTATTFTNGVVTEVNFSNGINEVVVNGKKIPVSQITQVS